MRRATSSASAIWGTRAGSTNETQLMSVRPVPASDSISRSRTGNGSGGSLWKPSRGPSSWIKTRRGRSDMAVLLATCPDWATFLDESCQTFVGILGHAQRAELRFGVGDGLGEGHVRNRSQGML